LTLDRSRVARFGNERTEAG